MKDRIRAVRKSLGFTQQEFAQDLGISKQAIVSYETDRRIPNASVISLICEKFNVRREWLENGTGEMMNPPVDEDAAVLDELLTDRDNPLYEVIRATVKTYLSLDAKDQEIILNFTRELLSKTKKEDQDDS